LALLISCSSLDCEVEHAASYATTAYHH
jgi:hypothetical protein